MWKGIDGVFWRWKGMGEDIRWVGIGEGAQDDGVCGRRIYLVQMYTCAETVFAHTFVRS